ncbi:endoribonuclease YbeY [Echinicola pacifica]|uniref:Endoribonuclease YbeY n=1 Tax=Echinicola pacifica TaxID=346377 RepID=A0A918UMC3_9BACT|nr:rRNA maturation RNase YbeY [Echinicola pacifica]GGZ20338.1 endoribonuclease YbeY [Echinicola pacifica]
MAVNFFTEDTKFDLKQKRLIKKWLKDLATKEGFTISELNYIFCSDEYLHTINLEYLNHDTYTDIITFDNSEALEEIEGDIFISIDRVKENATTEKQSFQLETIRVLSHGLLHLCGYKDKTKEEAKVMRNKEDESIQLFQDLESSK